MRARRTVASKTVFRLPGGNEDNDLWIEETRDEAGGKLLVSVWVPSEEERKAIANGENVALVVWGSQHPPVAMQTTSIELKGQPRE